MSFNMITKIIFLIAGLFFAICSIGANDHRNGERCVALATMFTTALIVLLIFDLKY